MSSISASTLSVLETALRQQRDALVQALHARTHHGDTPQELALDNAFASTDERAEAASMNETDIAQLNHDMQSLRQVDAALARMAAGSYGDCAQCGAPVALPRLLAEPSATRCLDCQASAEHAAQH